MKIYSKFENYGYVWVIVQKLCFFSILKLLSDFYSRICTLVPSTPLVETMFEEERVFF